MSQSQSAPNTATATQTAESGGLLEQIISATKQTERDRAEELVRTLIEQAEAKTVNPSYSPHSRDSLAGTAQPSGIA